MYVCKCFCMYLHVWDISVLPEMDIQCRLFLQSFVAFLHHIRLPGSCYTTKSKYVLMAWFCWTHLQEAFFYQFSGHAQSFLPCIPHEATTVAQHHPDKLLRPSTAVQAPSHPIRFNLVHGWAFFEPYKSQTGRMDCG